MAHDLIHQFVGSMSPEELSDKRKALRLTQAELAARLGVNVTTVYRWEAGKAVPGLSYSEDLREILSGFRAELSPFDELLLRQPAPTAIFDLRGHYLAANAAFAALAGRQATELVGEAVADVFPELQRGLERQYEEKIALVIRRRRDQMRLTVPLPRDPSKRISHRLDLVPQHGFLARYLHEISVEAMGRPAGSAS